jgi:undecaprenyl diphosphate synthase
MHPDNAPKLDLSCLPAHVAIIMDGNGRWAKKRLMNRVKGHEKGSDAVRTAVRFCRKTGIPYLTLYAFSTENWQRPQKEVSALMSLLKKFLTSEKNEMIKNNIRLNAIGTIEKLPEDVRIRLEETIQATKNNSGLRLTLALSYGSRDELTTAVRKIAANVKDGLLSPEDINENIISENLFTNDMPDPDLIIRTSGEMRVSNFLLWQIAYSEIYFTSVLWPEFDETEFTKILIDFQGRERRYGKVLQE